MNNDIYIIGAGVHGEVILDIFLRKNIKPKGFLDDNQNLWNKDLLGIRILGGIDLAKKINGKFVIAIGDNIKRKEIFEKLKLPLNSYINAIHDTAIISDFTEIGIGNMIIGGTVINIKTKIGNHVIINTSSSIDHHNTIEDFVHIAPGVTTGGNVFIGEGTLVGLGSKILPNIKVGKWSIIGAGSVVTKDIPDNVIALGIPAKVIKRRI